MQATLWILEDDRIFAFLLETVFSQISRTLDIKVFDAGEAALLATGTPDILVADTHLAGKLTGPEVVEMLRRRNPDLAVMFSSSFGRPPGIVFGPRDRCLPKPFSIAALVQQVTIMLSEIPRLQVPPPHSHPHSAVNNSHRQRPHKT
jgi:DNA-binding response OmpR family regulator